jgi:hypothetical protein
MVDSPPQSSKVFWRHEVISLELMVDHEVMGTVERILNEAGDGGGELVTVIPPGGNFLKSNCTGYRDPETSACAKAL